MVGKWDPYPMGYAPDGRGRFLDEAHLDLAYSTRETRVGATSGDAFPVILRGGRAVATWTYRLAGYRMDVEIRPFPGTTDPNSLVDDARLAFDAIGELLEARVRSAVADSAW